MKSQSILVLVVAVLLFGPVPYAFAATASFQGLGDLPGGDFHSDAGGVSADGSTVVGTSISASGTEAFRWTSASGMVGLGDLSGGDFDSRARGVSADGSTVVGYSHSASGTEAFRWTSGGGLVGLGDLSGGSFFSWALGVSADGLTVVGGSKSGSGLEAFRWTPASGMVGLGDLAGGSFRSSALAVSADGSTVVGSGMSAAPGGYPEAFRWTSASGMVGLRYLSGGPFWSEAYGVSADGSTVVGYGSSASGWEAFRWTSASGMVGLGDLPGGGFYSRALDVSADGSTVVGRSDSASGNEAFIWDTANGMQSLRDVLVNDYALNLTGWTLTSTEGISDDGLTIAGYGRNPDGYTEAWIATLREPPPPAKLRLIIDTDPAVGDSDPDDGTAIIYAFQSPDLCTVEAITYGYGNFGNQIIDSDGITRGGTRMLEYYSLQLDKMLEVLEEAGAIPPFPRENIVVGHKESETWDNCGGCPGVRNEASDFISDAVTGYPGEFTIVALGTLTNIATAMAHYPTGPENFLYNCKDLWVIGGGIDANNVFDCDTLAFIDAEYNIWRDKAAAEYVFSNSVQVQGEPKIKMVPLNATMRWLITRSKIDDVNSTDTRITNYLDFPLRWWIMDVNPLDHRQFDACEAIAIEVARNINAGNPVLAALAQRPLPWVPAFPPYDTIGMALALEPNLGSFYDEEIQVDANGTTLIVSDPCREPVRIFDDFDDNTMTDRIINHWKETTHHQPPENKCFLQCSDADYIVRYLHTLWGPQYAGPQKVSDDVDLFGQCYYHLPVGVHPYTYDLVLEDQNAKYRGRLYFDWNTNSIPSNAIISNVKLHLYCDRKFDWYDISHRVIVYSSSPFIQSALILWESINEMNRYTGPNDIGTLPAWRTINLGPKSVNDLQYIINGSGNQFAILLAEDGDDHPCAWFDTSKDWKAYLEVDFDLCPVADLSGDCQVTFEDFSILANQWLQPPGEPSADIAPSPVDGFVDFLDFAILAKHWLEGTAP